MTKIAKEVDGIITREARKLVVKGGSFEEVRQKAVRKIYAKYPRLDVGTLFGGFDHRYTEALVQRAA